MDNQQPSTRYKNIVSRSLIQLLQLSLVGHDLFVLILHAPPHFRNASDPEAGASSPRSDLWNGEGDPSTVGDALPGIEESARVLATEHNQATSRVVVDQVPTANLDDVPGALFSYILENVPKQPPKQLLATEQPPQPPEKVDAANNQTSEQVEAPIELSPEQDGVTNQQPSEQEVVTSQEPTELPPSQMLATPASSKRSVQYNDESQQVKILGALVCPWVKKCYRASS